MATAQVYSAMEPSELEALRADKLYRLERFQKEIRKLRKKYKSGYYDRQIICEYILSYQSQIAGLIASVDGINKILDQKLVTA